MSKKPQYGESGYSEPLSCGCIPGHFACPKACTLWDASMTAYGHKDYDAFNRLKKEYEMHKESQIKYEALFYIDNQGRTLFISQGIGTEWGTFYRKPSGSLARFKSPALPMRLTRESAERDLRDTAKQKKWKRIENDLSQKISNHP